VSVLVASITIYPDVGNSEPSVNTIEVSVAVIVVAKVVLNSKVDTATPPTGYLT